MPMHIGMASAIPLLCVPHEIIIHRSLHPLAEAWQHACTSVCDLLRRRSNLHDIDKKQNLGLVEELDYSVLIAGPVQLAD
jgi:hypothetical protein